MKIKNFLLVFVIVVINGAIISSCKDTKKKVSESETIVVTEDEPAVVELDEIWIIEEHKINNVPVTSKAIVKTEEVETEKEVKEAEQEMYDIATIEEIHEDLVELDYEAHQIVEVEEQIIPIDEIQTIVSYNKKGKEKGTLQVISSGPNNEVEQIIFTDKKHKDVYEISPGMSGKEVKKIRRELKHFVKKGQVFLYDDSSNIMYLMDAKDLAGDEIIAADVENMDVQAVIWKDKKHHKNNK